ncbi:SH3 and multiple ankyrin repeat domains protein 2-like [Panthera onca]
MLPVDGHTLAFPGVPGKCGRVGWGGRLDLTAWPDTAWRTLNPLRELDGSALVAAWGSRLPACRYGHVQHLEHLLFYGADMAAQNASGNTALHICALYNQDSCARVLLFRGGNKELKNYNSQTPFQVAIIAGNFELAEYIKNHKETDIVPLVPTRRTVSGAPPLAHRSPGGWARSCISEEPAGLFPPAPGLHRTCSGEQPHWTSGGELSQMVPIRGRGGRWAPRCLGRWLDGVCVSPPVPLPPCLSESTCLAVESLPCVTCGWYPPWV